MNEHIYKRNGRLPEDSQGESDDPSWSEGDGPESDAEATSDSDGSGDDRRAGSDKAAKEAEWRALFERELVANKRRREPLDDSAAGRFRGGDRAYTRLPVSRSRQLPAAFEARQNLPSGYASNAEYASANDEGSGLDLRKYLWLLFKHRWLLVGFATLGIAYGAISTLLTTPVYRASATIQINREVQQIVKDDDFSQVDGGGMSYEFYQTQFELLKSRALAERVAATLSLQDDPAFMSANVNSPMSNLKRLFFGAPPQSQGSSADVAAQQKAAAGRIMAGMSLQPVNNSTIVKIAYDSPNPAVAQKVVNGIVDAYIAENMDRRYGAAAYARTYLEERLQQLKQKLEDSEKQLVAYADAQKIVSVGEGQPLAGTNLAAANDALAKATSERIRLELLLKQMDGTDGISVPQMLESEAIAALRAKRAGMMTDYQEKLSSFKPAYPEMKKLKAQIDEVDQQMADEAKLVRDSVKSQYDTAVATEQSLTKQLEALKSDVTDFRNRNIQYTILQREVDTNRSLYDGLLQRYKEIGIAGGVGANNVSVVDKADGAGVISPNLKKNVSTALMLALLLGAAAAFGREQLDDTFKSPEDLEDSLGLPLLGIIPVTRSSAQHAKAVDDPHSPVAEAYRSLRTALQFSTSAGVPKTLLVTSSRAAEGKSTTALMLARNYAQVGLRVLLVDADLRKPSLHKQIKCDASVGLTNCLASPTVPSAAFQRTGLQGLTFMPSGPLPPNPAELLAGPKMLALLTAATDSYDLVILDGPPVAGLADAPLLSSVAAGTLFVIDGTKTRRNVSKAALKRLHFARAQVVGAVINKLDVSNSAYGYAYHHDDGSYYGERNSIEDKRGDRVGA